MTKIACSVSGKNGAVRTAVVPANRSEQTRFGLLDSVVIVVFLLCLTGLVCVLTR